MQGLEFVDVPGMYILASGAGVMCALLILTVGWRKRDRQVLNRLHVAVKTNIVLGEIDMALRSDADGPEEVSGTRVLDKNAWKGKLLEPDLDDEPTKPVIYTSADRALCNGGLTVRPIRKHSVA